MYALIKDNQIVQLAKNARSFFPNVSFPRGGPSRDFLAVNGVKEVVEGERKDERFYWVTPDQPNVQLVDGVPTRLYVSTPKDLDQLKEQYISQAKETANKELQPTDWMVTRLLERQVDIPEDVKSARANVIAKCEALEANVTSANTIIDLMNALFPVVVNEIQDEEEEVIVIENNSEEISAGNTDE